MQADDAPTTMLWLDPSVMSMLVLVLVLAVAVAGAAAVELLLELLELVELELELEEARAGAPLLLLPELMARCERTTNPPECWDSCM